MQKVWIICSLLPPPSPLPLLYLNFKSLKNPNSLYFIRFQCILLYLAVCFSEFWNFNKLKRGDQIYWGGQFCRKSELFPPPPPPPPPPRTSSLLYFNFKIFKEPNSLSFIRFQCTLHDSGVLFSESLNFSNLRGGGGGDLITGGRKFCRISQLFRPSFCISILEVLRTQNLDY